MRLDTRRLYLETGHLRLEIGVWGEQTNSLTLGKHNFCFLSHKEILNGNKEGRMVARNNEIRKTQGRRLNFRLGNSIGGRPGEIVGDMLGEAGM